MGIREKAVQALFHEQGDGSMNLLQKILFPLSLLYGGAAALRSLLYEKGIFSSRRLSRPVISVGNLVAGGTGKTPLVIRIAQVLSAQGLAVAVLSRGYKGKAKGAVNIVSDNETVHLNAREAGDEPCLMAHALPGIPVLVGKNRYAVGKQAIRLFDVDCLILDDGYQHLPLRRDCNLLLLDGEYPFGNGRCLPAGSLREGTGAMERADLMVLSGDPGEDLLLDIRKMAPARSIHRVRYMASGVRRLPGDEVEPVSILEGKRIMAFAGIARPERFYRSLEKAGADLVSRRNFADHHTYTEGEIHDIYGEGGDRGADFLVTTEKDAVRLPVVPETIPLLALQLSVVIQDEQDLIADIRHCMGLTSVKKKGL